MTLPHLLDPVQHKRLGSASPVAIRNLGSSETQQQFSQTHPGFCRHRHGVEKLGVNRLRIGIIVMRMDNDLSFIRLQGLFEHCARLLLFFVDQSKVVTRLWHAAHINDVSNILVAGLSLQCAVNGVPLLVVFHDIEGCRVTLHPLLELWDRVLKMGGNAELAPTSAGVGAFVIPGPCWFGPMQQVNPMI